MGQLHTRLANALCYATVSLATFTASVSVGQEKRAESTSPLDQLDAGAIPAEERFDWQPKELVAVLGSHRARHWGGIESVAFSPNGKQIASAGDDSVIRLWDAQTLRQIAILRGHNGNIYAVAYSKDAKTLASAGADGTVRLWGLTASPPTAKQALSGHESIIYSLAYSADDKSLATGDGRGTVRLWDLSGKVAQLRAKLPPPIESQDLYKHQAVAFSPDGTLLATGNLFYVVLWDLKGKEPVKVRTLKPSDLDSSGDYFPCRVQSLAFSPDGKTLAAGHYDHGGTRLWDLTGDLKHQVATLDTGTTRKVTFAPNGKTLASVGGSWALMWDLTQTPPKLQHTLPKHRYSLATVTIAPDGKCAVTAGEDCLLHLWDLDAKDPKSKLPVRGHDDEIRLSTLSPDGRTLATASWDGSLRLWDLGGKQPKPRHTFQAVSPYATAFTFTTDGKKLITANCDATVRIWDVSAGAAQLQKTLSQGKPTSTERDEIWGLAVSRDGKTAVTAGRFHALRLWDLASEAPADPVTVEKPRRYHGALAFSPDEKTVVAGNSDSGAVRLWSVTDGKAPTLQHLGNAGNEALHAVAIAPDGNTIISGGDDGVVRFWSLGGGILKQEATLDHKKGGVSSVHYSPDGSKLVVAYANGYVFLGDPAGKKLRDWQLDGGTSVQFAPDGHHLLMQNANTTLYILRLQK
jgi:WD40 repeat protein